MDALDESMPFDRLHALDRLLREPRSLLKRVASNLFVLPQRACTLRVRAMTMTIRVKGSDM